MANSRTKHAKVLCLQVAAYLRKCTETRIKLKSRLNLIHKFLNTNVIFNDWIFKC